MPFEPSNVWETNVDVLPWIEFEATSLLEADLDHCVANVLDGGISWVTPRSHDYLTNEKVNAPSKKREDWH